MNYFDISMEFLIPYVVDAYTKVFGKEYKEIIKNRLEEIILLPYNNIKGMESYVSYLRDRKSKEITIRYLKEFGADINQNEDFIKKLNKEIFDVIKNLDLVGYIKVGINNWRDVEPDTDLEGVEENKIRFINYLRGEKKQQITKETFKEFCETDEYKQILEKIEEYLVIYDKIQESSKQIQYEIEEYEKELAPYQRYIDDETKRKKDIEARKIDSLYAQIEEYLPEDVKHCLDKKYSSVEEKSRAIFGQELGLKANIEYFSQEDEAKLNEQSSEFKEEFEKTMIYSYRLNCLRDIGAIDEKEIKGLVLKEAYEYAIKQEYVQKFILKKDVIDKITKLRTKAYEEVGNEFIYESDDFNKYLKMIGDTQNVKEYFYGIMHERTICVSGAKKDGELFKLFPFTVRENEKEILDFVILHELCHAIEGVMLEDNLYYCGFEHMDKGGVNPYDNRWREYEKFNEVITDMFAIEAMEYLHDKGIYLLDKEDKTDKDIWKELSLDEKIRNYNTDSILKQIVEPFLSTYRGHIIKARMTGDREKICEIVGKENFEELNDIVNKVESLISQGLISKLEQENSVDSIVIEYNEQLERVKQVYANMEVYEKEGINNNSLLKSAIEATKEITREGQINEATSNVIETFKEHEEEMEH